jgi:hypothetical protein
MSIWLVIALASLFLAIAIAIRIWTGSEALFFKYALTIVVFIPVIGPLAYLWVSNWPTSSPPQLRSNFRGEQLDAELERLYARRKIPQVTPAKWSGRSFFPRQLSGNGGQSFISRLRQPSGFWFGVILTLGAIFLANWWLLALVFVRAGWPWGYPNFWGGSVGTILIFSMLSIATPLYFLYAWRNWPSDA